MAITLAAEQAYATITDADLYFETNTTWSALTEEQKQDALLWGRYWLDVNYSCDSLLTIPRELILANCLLALDYIEQGDLFFVNDNAVKYKRVKAGDVETEKAFLAPSSQKANSSMKVFALLKNICVKNNTLHFLGRA